MLKEGADIHSTWQGVRCGRHVTSQKLLFIKLSASGVYVLSTWLMARSINWLIDAITGDEVFIKLIILLKGL